MVQHAPWPEDHTSWAEATAYLSQVYDTCHREPWSTWLTRQICHCPMTGLTLFPLLQHTPTSSQHGCYHWAYARRHMPTSSYDEERSWGVGWSDRKRESQGTKRETKMSKRLGGLEGIHWPGWLPEIPQWGLFNPHAHDHWRINWHDDYSALRQYTLDWLKLMLCSTLIDHHPSLSPILDLHITPETHGILHTKTSTYLGILPPTCWWLVHLPLSLCVFSSTPIQYQFRVLHSKYYVS